MCYNYFMKRTLTLLAVLVALIGCSDDKMAVRVGLFNQSLSELNSQKLREHLAYPEEALLIDYFYDGERFSYQDTLFVKEVLSQPFDIGSKRFSDKNNNQGSVEIIYHVVDPMLLKNLTIDRDNVLNSLRNLIISADKTKEIILNIPVIYIDGEWKIDSIKELNLYQSLFDIYDELDLWEPTEEFIPY